MGAIIVKDIPNYEKWVGVPAKCIGWNLLGLRKRYPNKTEEEIIELCVVS